MLAFAKVAAIGIALVVVVDSAHAANLVRIVVTPGTKNVRAGDVVVYHALGEFDDGTYAVDLSGEVTWSSSNPAVATVSDGTTTTIAAGEATIRATHGSGLQSDPTTGTLRVVSSLESISLTPEHQLLPVRRGTRFKAWGTFEDGIVLNLRGDAQFSVDDPTVASITETGLARGVKPGQAVVSAFDRLTGISSTASGNDVVFTVVGDLEALSLTPERIALSVGDRTDLEARAHFQGDCRWFDFGSRLRWTSSDDDVVKVTRDGVIECLQEGTATISIRDRRISSQDSGDDSTVICGGNPVGIKVSPQSFIVPVGAKRGLEATYIFGDGTEADGTRSVVFSSSQPSVVAITRASGRNEGEALAVAPGQASIIAFDPVRNLSSNDPGGANGLIEVPGALLSLEVLPLPPASGDPVHGQPGTSVRFNVLGMFEGGLVRAIKQLVAWSSSDTNVATLPSASTCPQTGQIDLLDEGSSTISVTFPKTGGPGAVTDSIDVIVAVPTPTPTPAPTPTPHPGSPSGAFIDGSPVF